MSINIEYFKEVISTSKLIDYNNLRDLKKLRRTVSNDLNVIVNNMEKELSILQSKEQQIVYDELSQYFKALSIIYGNKGDLNND